MFPFRYNGVSYNTCTLQQADDNKPWCSTLVDDNNNHVSGGGHYGDCGPKCPLPDPTLPDPTGKKRQQMQQYDFCVISSWPLTSAKACPCTSSLKVV